VVPEEDGKVRVSLTLITVELPVPTLTPVLAVPEGATELTGDVVGKVLVSLTETVEEPTRLLEAVRVPVNVGVDVPLGMTPVL
jgi:hypothetical protein